MCASNAEVGIRAIGLSRYRGSIWCHRPVRDPPWTRRRPKTFGNHSFSIIELPHERLTVADVRYVDRAIRFS
jgi:hypothetical protein